MSGIYNIFIRFYGLLIRLTAPFSQKAKQWVQGRKRVWSNLESFDFSTRQRLVWMHVASLGEFEQGRPVIESLKKYYPNVQIALSFFSPSGFEVRKDYPLADYVFYLPLDSRQNALRLLNILRPDLIIFVKYDFWYHYLHEAQKQSIPVLLISALFRKDQYFFKWYGKWMKTIIQNLTHIFVQNEASAIVLQNNAILSFSISGDTRVDRVAQQADLPFSNPVVEQFLNGKPLLICGSTWPEDEDILYAFIHKNYQEWQFIIAPHDISESRIKHIEKCLKNTGIRYSEAHANSVKGKDVLIIDNIGLLSSLYRFAKVAYIGGAFGKGLHNTLEPISYGIPVIFGPKYQKFEEARWLVQHQAGFSIQSAWEFNQVMNKLANKSFYTEAAKKAEEYIQHNKGATEHVLNYIRNQQLLK